MKTILITIVVLLIVILIIGAYIISSRNEFIKLEEMIKNAKNQIAVQLESRFDALTSLIGATNKYASHEAQVLKEVVEKRQNVSGISSVETLNNSEEVFQSTLSRLMAVAESYPDLKADKLYLQTMDSLNNYEKNVRLSRMTFNDTITKYNRKIKSIPANIIAAMFSFQSHEYIDVNLDKKEMPQWK